LWDRAFISTTRLSQYEKNLAELEKQLAGSDLTDEEKDQIRKTFQQEQRDGGKGTKGGG